MEAQTERPLGHEQLIPRAFSQQYSLPKLFLFIPQTTYLHINNFVIYTYKSQEHFTLHPTKPLKYFNMNTLEAQITTPNCLTIKDYQFEVSFINEDVGKISELMDVIEHNRRLIEMERLFPRRFEEMDERLGEKIKEKEGQEK